MKNLSFNNKKFVLVQNSKTGKVNSETLFFYKQERDLVTADYQGGTVRYGKIIALLENDKLDMLYQCVTDEGQLKAGKALATLSFTESQKIRLKLNWEWITGEISRGNSEYIEIRNILKFTLSSRKLVRVCTRLFLDSMERSS